MVLIGSIIVVAMIVGIFSGEQTQVIAFFICAIAVITGMVIYAPSPYKEAVIFGIIAGSFVVIIGVLGNKYSQN